MFFFCVDLPPGCAAAINISGLISSGAASQVRAPSSRVHLLLVEEKERDRGRESPGDAVMESRSDTRGGGGFELVKSVRDDQRNRPHLILALFFPSSLVVPESTDVQMRRRF